MTSCGCGSATTETKGASLAPSREIAVDLYFIDIASCDRCQDASNNLREAIELVAPSLAAMGVAVRLSETLVETAGQAEAVGLATSPSIRIDGFDIQPDVQESSCAACSSLPQQANVDCRVWAYGGRQFTSPPIGLIVEALMRAAVSAPVRAQPAEDYVMPANLRAFFTNKAGVESARKKAASCCCS